MALDLSPEDRALVERVDSCFKQADSEHKRFCDQADYRYARYRNFQRWRDGRDSTAPRDKDTFWNDATRDWGAKLSIPFGFSTIETIVPRILSQSPRMLVLPRDRVGAENVRNMKALIDYQQDSIDFELVLQDVAKDGLMTGLGVLKTFWRKEVRETQKIVPSQVPMAGREWIQVPTQEEVFDSNDAEAVDVRDFIRDPFGYDMRSIRWCIHRLWLTDEDVERRVESGQWRGDWPLEELKAIGSPNKRSEVWAGRDKASGRVQGNPKEGRIHEVWEFHDRQRVITVLDREIPVQVGGNPAWHGQLPFQIYRPTRLSKEFVGVSELEPLQDLLDEMDTLRSQRRDNATFVLQRTVAYAEGLVDPSDLKVGPGLGIPVNGDPRDLLFPLPIQDIPYSGYAEENALVGDIERTSGISDAVSGAEGNAGGASATATGAQLVHAAANVRIQLKTKNLEKETVRNACRQWVRNNQQRIVSNKDIPVPKPPEPGDDTPAWEWLEIGPGELAGAFEIVCEGGSTAPENIPQMRQDAQLKAQLLMPYQGQIDQRHLLTSLLHDLGVDSPESWITPEEMVPASQIQGIFDALQQMGVDPNMIAQAAQAAEAGKPPPGPPQGENGSEGGSQAPQNGAGRPVASQR